MQKREEAEVEEVKEGKEEDEGEENRGVKSLLILFYNVSLTRISISRLGRK